MAARPVHRMHVGLVLLSFAIVTIVGWPPCYGRVHAETHGGATYVHRWNVTELPPGRIAPPLQLIWTRTPILLERWNPGGLSESPSRRIADLGETLITVMRRKLYYLRKVDGLTVATVGLEGAEIFDWMVVGRYFVYTSGDTTMRAPIRGAVDLESRKTAWTQREPRSLLHGEWVLGVNNTVALFGVHDPSRDGDELVAIDASSGGEKWRSPNRAEDRPVPFTWFANRTHLHVLASGTGGIGLYLDRIDLTEGRRSKRAHLHGLDRIGNIYHPRAMLSDGSLIVGYNKLLRPGDRFVLRFSVDGQRLLWRSDSFESSEGVGDTIKQVISWTLGEPVVATITPNKIALVNAATGAITRMGRLDGYTGWTDPNAVAYSYPYLISTARRMAGSEMLYELVVVNLETMRLEWTYEIDRQSRGFQTASAEILNFVLSDDMLYVGRADGRVMAFKVGGRQ